MEINKLRKFNLTQVTKLNSQGVILIDESHYIGSFLSTTELSPITLDGLRYSVIDGVDFSSDSVNSQVYSVPTGVNSDQYVPIQHSAFRFNRFLVYDRVNEESEINIYIGSELVATIFNFEITDRLILITDQLIDPEDYHKSARAPHNLDSYLLTQSRVNQFNTVTELDSLGSQLNVPLSTKLQSAFNVMGYVDRVRYDNEYLFRGHPLDEFILDVDRLDTGLGLNDIPRKFNEPTLTISNKFI